MATATPAGPPYPKPEPPSPPPAPHAWVLSWPRAQSLSLPVDPASFGAGETEHGDWDIWVLCSSCRDLLLVILFQETPGIGIPAKEDPAPPGLTCHFIFPVAN